MRDGVSQNIGAAAVLQYWLGELDGQKGSLVALQAVLQQRAGFFIGVKKEMDIQLPLAATRVEESCCF